MICQLDKHISKNNKISKIGTYLAVNFLSMSFKPTTYTKMRMATLI